MRRKGVAKRIAVGLLSAGLFIFGGCLNLDTLVRFGAFYGAAEFLLDNDQVFDLFPDSGNLAN